MFELGKTKCAYTKCKKNAERKNAITFLRKPEWHYCEKHFNEVSYFITIPRGRQ
jgi:hypothetical protein